MWMRLSAALLLILGAAGGPATAQGEGGSPLEGNWISENDLLLLGLEGAEDLPDEYLEVVITQFAFQPDGTWRTREEDALGVMCYHTAWPWVVDGDTLRVPGRPDLRWHVNLNDDHNMLILTSPVGGVGVYLADDAPVDTTGCQYDPEMLPFW